MRSETCEFSSVERRLWGGEWFHSSPCRLIWTIETVKLRHDRIVHLLVLSVSYKQIIAREGHISGVAQQTNHFSNIFSNRANICVALEVWGILIPNRRSSQGASLRKPSHHNRWKFRVCSVLVLQGNHFYHWATWANFKKGWAARFWSSKFCGFTYNLIVSRK